MKHFKLLLSLFLVVITSSLYAESITVTGKVIDHQTKEPIIGASVVTASRNGTITDLDGLFSLSANKGELLTVSYIGYESVQMVAQPSMEIILKEATEELEELIVTGYTAQRKVDLTGAVGVLDMKEPMSEGTPNVLNSLQGRIPGVQVITDAAPGAGGSSIRIRGFSTINGNAPLYVIDGVATTENLNSLNPNDIASIQVLKDASSASIYGSRAANGVVVITTKQAEKGRLSVNLSYNATVQTVANQFKMLSAEQWGQVYWDAMKNARMTPWHPFYGFGTKPKLVEYLDKDKKVKASNTNWQDEIYHPAWTHDVNASVGYSSEKARVYFSGNFMDQKGLMDYTYYRRYSARINSDFNIGKWVKVGENLMVANWNDNGFSTQDDRGIPYTAMRQHPAIPVKDIDGKFTSPLQLANSDIANPVHVLYNGRDNSNQSWRIFGNAFLEINPYLKGLYIKTNIGIEHIQYMNAALNRKIEPTDVNSLSRGYGQGDTWTWTNTIRYENVFGGKHHVNALFGTEAIGYKYDGISAWRDKYAFEDPSYMVLDAGEGTQTNGGNLAEWALFSIFARAEYNYADRYLFSAIVRRDATSRLNKNNNSAVFPAFSAAWRFTAEPFFPQQKYFTNGKLRVGWGQNGNAAIDNNYASYSTYAYSVGSAAYDLNASNTETVAGVIVSTTGNKDLRWETTSQINVGLDMGMFNNSLNISFDWYLKDTKDMLTVPPTLSVAGENAAKWQNTGNMRNMGIELILDYHSPDYNGFSWGGAFNISHYKNEVTKLNDFVDHIGGDIRLVEGQPMGVYYGYVVDGIFKDQAEVDAHATQQGKGVGRFKYRDLDANGLIDEKDQKIIGDPNPDVVLGLNLDFRYKGFYVNMFFNGEIGFDIYNTTLRQLNFMSYGISSTNRSANLLNAWTPENPNATIPMVCVSDNNNEVRASTYFVEDGSYFKMKYLRVGYDFPKKLLTPWHCTGLNIHFQVENVFTATRYSGLDPELPLGAYGARVDAGPYPRSRSFSMGLNLSF